MTALSFATPPGMPRWRMPATAHAPRVWQALTAFAIGGFGIGLTQSGAASVIQDQVTDLDTSVGMLGYTMMAYALGVVVGSPLIMIGMGRVNRRPLLFWLMAAFVLTTVATVFAPNVESLFAIRLVSGFPHGAFLGTASYVAVMMMGRERRGRAISTIMLGLTTSAIVGIPAMQWLSNEYSWRIAYLVVAAVGLLCLAGVWAFVPSITGNPHTSFVRELRSLRGKTLWTALVTITVGFAGFSAVFSYIVPMLEETTGLGPSQVTWALVGWGIGLSAGAYIGGRLTDRAPVLAARIGLAATAAMLLAIGLLGAMPIPAIALMVLLPMSIQIFSQSSQNHLMDVIDSSPSLGAAMSHAALNAANAVGAGCGALVLSFGFGYLAPAWVAFALTLVALVIVFVGAGYRQSPDLKRAKS